MFCSAKSLFIVAAGAFLLMTESALPQPVTVRARAASYDYDLKPGQCLQNIPVPAHDVPIRVFADQTVYPKGGVAEALIMQKPAAAGLEWISFVTTKAPKLLGGYATGQQRLMWIDGDGAAVDVEIQDGTHVQVCNAATGGLPQANGTLTFVW